MGKGFDIKKLLLILLLFACVQLFILHFHSLFGSAVQVSSMKFTPFNTSRVELPFVNSFGADSGIITGSIHVNQLPVDSFLIDGLRYVDKISINNRCVFEQPEDSVGEVHESAFLRTNELLRMGRNSVLVYLSKLYPASSFDVDFEDSVTPIMWQFTWPGHTEALTSGAITERTDRSGELTGTLHVSRLPAKNVKIAAGAPIQRILVNNRVVFEDRSPKTVLSLDLNLTNYLHKGDNPITVVLQVDTTSAGTLGEARSYQLGLVDKIFSLKWLLLPFALITFLVIIVERERLRANVKRPPELAKTLELGRGKHYIHDTESKDIPRRRLYRFVFWLAVFVQFIAFSSFTMHKSLSPSSWNNENCGSRFMLTKSLAKYHSFSVTMQDVKFYTHSGHDFVLLNDRYFSDKPPGISILGVPFYYLGSMGHDRGVPLFEMYGFNERRDAYGYFFMILALYAFCAFGVLKFYDLCCLFFAQRISFILSLAFVSSMYFIYALDLWSHSFVTVCMITAVYYLFRRKQVRAGVFLALALWSDYIQIMVMVFLIFYIAFRDEKITEAFRIFRSLILVLALWVIYTTVGQFSYLWPSLSILTVKYSLVAVGIGMLVLFHHTAFKRALGQIIAFFLPISVIILFYGFYHQSNFDQIVTTSYTFASGHFVSERPSLAVKLFDIFVSRWKGLFFYYPLLLWAILGLYYAARSNLLRTILLIGIPLIYTAVVIQTSVYYGGHCFGPRQLVPLVPLLLLFVGEFLVQESFWKLRIVTVPITVVFFFFGVFHTFLSAFISRFPATTLFPDPIYGYLRIQFFKGVNDSFLFTNVPILFFVMVLGSLTLVLVAYTKLTGVQHPLRNRRLAKIASTDER